MRTTAPSRALLGAVCLGALLIGVTACKSPVQRACANKVKVEGEKLRSLGVSLGDKTEEEVAADCVELLATLKTDVAADDALWSTYLECLERAESDAQVNDCLLPLTQHKMKVEIDRATSRRGAS
ncbi:MAG: hypothetical protein R3A51_05730 [Nannocystaceae bacterium]|nr:hypothetical protein [Myxococcales bacterium]